MTDRCAFSVLPENRPSASMFRDKPCRERSLISAQLMPASFRKEPKDRLRSDTRAFICGNRLVSRPHGQFLVKSNPLLPHTPPFVVFAISKGFFCDTSSEFGVGKQSQCFAGNTILVAFLNKKSVSLVIDDVRYPAGICRNDRQPARECFDNRIWHVVNVRRVQKHIGPIVDARHIVRLNHSQKLHISK